MQIEFWQKAQENLADAEAAFEKGRFNASANRAYYAALQAAIAALANEGFASEKISHEWVQSVFNRELTYRKKIYSAQMRSVLLDMQEVRNVADYKRMMLKKSDSKIQLENAKEFVQSIQKRLEK